MIVSHQFKFVIAVPVGLDAGDWLTRIADEGDQGYLEIMGYPNGVCVPEGCEGYRRYFCDDSSHRLPQLWQGRGGTPWEGPPQVQSSAEEWFKWYVYGMRRKYLEMGVHSSPNGWGMRGKDGDWVYFEHPKYLRRAFEGRGNSPLGEVAPWGVSSSEILRLQEPSRGWKNILGTIRATYAADKGMPPEAKNTFDLIRWHVPVTQAFYELPNELVNTFNKENARESDRI